MLLRNRPPAIDSSPLPLRTGYQHLEQSSIAVLRWLNANKIDYVLVGPLAYAIRGDSAVKGPVAIVPAPYGRNFDRLARALVGEHAALRSERGVPGSTQRGDAVTVKLSGAKLARGRRWKLRFGDYDLDVESSGKGGGDGTGRTGGTETAHSIGASGARYQELLYEANRITLADGVSVEVASPEDLEHYSHVRRTGQAPEFRVTRNETAEAAAPADPTTDGEAKVSPEPQADGAGQPETSPDARPEHTGT
jgi:hypothetical protein